MSVRDKPKKDIPERMSPVRERPTKRLKEKTSPARAIAAPVATDAEMQEVGQKRGHEPSAGPEDNDGGDITRSFVEALSVDTA